MAEEAITAADATQNFLELLEVVRQGKSFVVTSHGEPVARIVPIVPMDGARTAGRETLFERLREQPVVEIGTWTRDGLYGE